MWRQAPIAFACAIDSPLASVVIITIGSSSIANFDRTAFHFYQLEAFYFYQVGAFQFYQVEAVHPRQVHGGEDPRAVGMRARAFQAFSPALSEPACRRNGERVPKMPCEGFSPWTPSMR
jgi:hypothetical protein